MIIWCLVFCFPLARANNWTCHAFYVLIINNNCAHFPPQKSIKKFGRKWPKKWVSCARCNVQIM